MAYHDLQVNASMKAIQNLYEVFTTLSWRLSPVAYVRYIFIFVSSLGVIFSY